jgi:hypothetical protein
LGGETVEGAEELELETTEVAGTGAAAPKIPLYAGKFALVELPAGGKLMRVSEPKNAVPVADALDAGFGFCNGNGRMDSP